MSAGAGRVGQQRCEPLHPPVHGHVVDFDATLGEELLHIAIGEPEQQVPTHRADDDLGWEPAPGERRTRGRRGPDENTEESSCHPHRPPRPRANATEPLNPRGRPTRQYLRGSEHLVPLAHLPSAYDTVEYERSPAMNCSAASRLVKIAIRRHGRLAHGARCPAAAFPEIGVTRDPIGPT